MILGILTALGTTKLSAITLGIVLIYLCILALSRKRQIQIPIILWLLTGCIALSAIWSVNPGAPVWICLHILIAYLAYQVLPPKHAKWGIALVATVQIGVVLWQYIYTDAMRPAGISRNASVLGLAGMWMMPGLLPSLMAGLSISRTALLGAGLFALTGRRYIIPAVILISVSIGVTLLNSPNRLSLDGIRQSWDIRADALHGVTSEPNPLPDPLKVTPVEVTWRWYGYGYGQYYLATGQIQPHNIFVRTWYEMGLFTIPIGYCLVYMWVSMRSGRGLRGQDWRFLAVACATGMLTDELLGSVEGVYMVLGYAIIHSNARRPGSQGSTPIADKRPGQCLTGSEVTA